MNTIPSQRLVQSIATLFLLVSLAACSAQDQAALQKLAEEASQTAVAQGQKQVETQAAQLQATAIAAAQTAAAKGAATAGTRAAELRQTAEAEIKTRLASRPSDVNPDVESARQKLKAMSAMQSHWTQVRAPIQNTLGQRNPAKYADVIDQFDVNAAELAGRYKAGGAGNDDTRCNIFAGDVMRAMGVPLPTKGNLGKGQGNPNSTYTDPMTAQAILLNEYLNLKLLWVTSANDPGKKSDWVEIVPTTDAELRRLIDHVNSGKPAVASDAGHIAVIRPFQPSVKSWRELIIAQAGASNFLTGPIKDNTYWTPQFFIHE